MLGFKLVIVSTSRPKKQTVAATANQSSVFSVFTMCSLVPERAMQERIATTKKNHAKIWINGDLLKSVISTCSLAMIAMSVESGDVSASWHGSGLHD